MSLNVTSNTQNSTTLPVNFRNKYLALIRKLVERVQRISARTLEVPSMGRTVHGMTYSERVSILGPDDMAVVQEDGVSTAASPLTTHGTSTDEDNANTSTSSSDVDDAAKVRKAGKNTLRVPNINKVVHGMTYFERLAILGSDA